MSDNFDKELLSIKVPAVNSLRFTSATAVIHYIRDYVTSEEQVLQWLAYEYQNDRRMPVVYRLHQRYNRLRGNRERDELRKANRGK